MTKQTKMLLGVGAVALAGYLIWKQSQKPKTFANLTARTRSGSSTLMADSEALAPQPRCNCHTSVETTPSGIVVYKCKNGNESLNSDGPCK